MTLERTIQSMFDHHPLIFRDRADCLNHLFCVLGSGYYWRDGELVEDGAREPVNELTNNRAAQRVPLTARSVAVLRARARAESTGETVDEAQFDGLPNDPAPSRPRRERWYFLRRDPDVGETVELHENLVPLWRVPPDVRPDWRAGVDECLAMLHEDGILTDQRGESPCT